MAVECKSSNSFGVRLPSERKTFESVDQGRVRINDISEEIREHARFFQDLERAAEAPA